MAEFEFRVIDEQEFYQSCERGFCRRKTFVSKQCEKQSKRQQCYSKYVDSEFKRFNKHIEGDTEWLKVKEILLERDAGCLVEKCLTKEEKDFCKKQDGYFLNKFIDGAHIVPCSEMPDQKYNPDNVFLCGRFYHDRLDNFRDLVTNQDIGVEGKKLWIERIMISAGLWQVEFTYNDFVKQLKGE